MQQNSLEVKRKRGRPPGTPNQKPTLKTLQIKSKEPKVPKEPKRLKEAKDPIEAKKTMKQSTKKENPTKKEQEHKDIEKEKAALAQSNARLEAMKARILQNQK